MNNEKEDLLYIIKLESIVGNGWDKKRHLNIHYKAIGKLRIRYTAVSTRFDEKIWEMAKEGEGSVRHTMALELVQDRLVETNDRLYFAADGCGCDAENLNDELQCMMCGTRNDYTVIKEKPVHYERT